IKPQGCWLLAAPNADRQPIGVSRMRALPTFWTRERRPDRGVGAAQAEAPEPEPEAAELFG
ncbi:MAG TPA: hypothetical protein VJ822_14130, partial [Dongiaceae bacterium]|nr:hypothetical protein [Dongiaceae bacterium]